ncbi:MAG: 1-deoxy-D-xylulose-5-phosphate reductoisomerase [Betaproteobacteria bacterium]|nr:1-deoxy-D-xylulose-5-phosphate reductoisomerase [Betaproteobacteria bacterium]
MKSLTILGATGSIGVSTLEVVRLHPDQFRVFALSGRTQIARLAAQCIEFSPRYAVVDDDAARLQLLALLRDAGCTTQVLSGNEGLIEVASADEVDLVMAAIVGAAGLAPTLAAASSGKRVLLANKEALVVGGTLVTGAARRSGATIVPIDSEHSAIFQCLPPDRASWPSQVHRVVLTASGGPFLRVPLADMQAATPAQAIAHPKWVMGRKISVDSATMMNKGLEVIEAHHLFGFEADRISVMIHPQSIVHSMVELIDGSVLAQLGSPDMRTPIAVGLGYPQRIASGAPLLDLLKTGPLEFIEPQAARFPSLALAYRALRGPAGSTAVLNAANEVAVQAFLDSRLGFMDIVAVCADVLDRLSWAPPHDLGDVLDLDLRSRSMAEAAVRSRRH